METVVEKGRYTYEDYIKASEEGMFLTPPKRYELIEGELLMAPSPVTAHQRILIKLLSEIFNFITQNSLGEVFTSPYDVVLDEYNVLQLDIIFVSKERAEIITEKNIKGAPDLVVEIISESTAYRDTIQKKRLYARFGIKEYWIVAPDDKLVEVYVLKDKEDTYSLVKIYLEDHVLESTVLKGLKIDLKKIFQHL
jgi:Uma2 family endonuclease